MYGALMEENVFMWAVYVYYFLGIAYFPVVWRNKESFFFLFG